MRALSPMTAWSLDISLAGSWEARPSTPPCWTVRASASGVVPSRLLAYCISAWSCWGVICVLSLMVSPILLSYNGVWYTYEKALVFMRGAYL